MKDIPGYEGLYAVTENGDIWSHPKPRSSKNGKWLKKQMLINKKDRNKPQAIYCSTIQK